MRSKKTYLLAYFLLLLPGVLAGQSRFTDSLEQKLANVTGEPRVDILNLLTYEYITIDTKKVLAYNTEALDLSKSIRYLKGEARARTYLGVHEYLSGQLPEGHRDLNTGLHLAQRANDTALYGYTLLQLGNCSLEEVEMDSAIRFFTLSRAIFQDSTDPATLSKIYRNLGALYGQRYQTDSQRYYFDRAIRIRRMLPNKSLLVEALVAKIKAKIELNEFQDAQNLLREADGFVSNRPGDEENLNDLRHIRALILFQRGKHAQADVLFDSARNYFLKKSLLRKYVTLLIDLGKVFTARGEYELALSNLYDALRLSQARHFDAESAIIRIQIGWIYQQLGNTSQALHMADDAIVLHPRKLLLADRADALTLKGVVLTDMNKFVEAYKCLDSVLRIYSGVGSIRGKSETLTQLGALASKQGNYAVAIRHYQNAVALARQVEYNYGLAWSYWRMGDAYYRLGNFADAIASLTASQKYADGASEILVLNYTTHRDLLMAQKRYPEALHYSLLASQLRDSIHNVDVARRFVNLEKIEEIEQHERNIRILQQEKELSENKLSLQEARLKQLSTFIIGGLVSIALLGGLVLMYYRFNVSITAKNASIVEQADKLREAHKELKKLYTEVSEQKEEIQLQADTLAESNRTISDVNRNLEKVVEEKTAQLTRTNNELIKYNNELLQFSYAVSHNLRGPVARLLGLTELAKHEQQLIETAQLVDFIGQTASELDMIINDLSKILELRNAPQHLLEAVPLEKEWRHSKSLLQDSLTGREEIVTDFTALPEIRTVRAMLQSIFYNLLSNAIKYRSPERTLRVVATSRRENGNAVLEIADNGLGINIARHNEHIFKLYKRFHTHVEGRGIGLYLIKSQVDVLHGSIEVTSEPDKGAVFRVILPIPNPN
jgi:signal transduction histidine kinase